ncbi:ribosome assembly protein Rsa3 [Schizosaccharomyces osmophilus]|uniref:Ribosome assembly protein Rsa3 n=1 Tax=Schizosaccharomyces osmophilus TaxID=2545709 RepID=A0AAE9WCU6_9SCHI|nr:ribosome assembly protein Rsa3 [Schizosaccharomyces osmophilus]WBW74006.1 ribosome assembly protein Rsa3 [Schizosaccharomyces osmophilus]
MSAEEGELANSVVNGIESNTSSGFQLGSQRELEKPSLGEYMEQLTTEFAEELDTLRQKEIFDQRKLQMLIEGLRAGHKIYE